MKVAISGASVYAADMTPAELATIRTWGTMSAVRASDGRTAMRAPISLDTLDRLAGLLMRETPPRRLPPEVEAVREGLRSAQSAVDKERMREHPAPLVPYPVRRKMYEHQVRAANMAMLVFGWANEKGGEVDGR